MHNARTHSRKIIVGLGLTGMSCARYLQQLNENFIVVDSRENPPLAEQFKAEFAHIDTHFGAFDAHFFTPQDELIISPGIALETPALASALAKGAKLNSDIGLFIAATNKPIIAITGSNGKSTVTTLVAQMLCCAGINAVAAGNIGLPVLDLLSAPQDYEMYVLELSSFQLERLENLGAAVAVVLNVTEDHLDRYAGFAEYQAAKLRIYQQAKVIVENRAQSFVTGEPSQIIRFGLDKPAKGEFGLVDGFMAFGDEKILATSALKIRGSHNIQNALAALALCHGVGVPYQVCLQALVDFSGLEHRCQFVTQINGVAFYNDSKATNTGAAIAAIEGLYQAPYKIVLIAGGQDKDSDFTELAQIIARTVRRVILIGKDGPVIAKALAADSYEYADTMQHAVDQAILSAQDGDIVLLAPACASLDMYSSYKQRGDVFVQCVKARESQQHD